MLFLNKFGVVVCNLVYLDTLTYEAMYDSKFIENIRSKRDLLLDQVQHLEAILAFSQLDPIEYSSADTSAGRKLVSGEKMPYIKGDNYQKKIAGILKQYNHFMSINEMANVVNAFESKITIEEVKKGLGSAKNLLLKSGAIVKHQVGTNNSNTFYGSPSWVDEDKIPKKEHMYNESSLQLKQTIEI